MHFITFTSGNRNKCPLQMTSYFFLFYFNVNLNMTSLSQQSVIYPLLKKATLDKDQLFNYRTVLSPTFNISCLKVSNVLLNLVWPITFPLIPFSMQTNLLTANIIPLKLLSYIYMIIWLMPLALRNILSVSSRSLRSFRHHWSFHTNNSSFLLVLDSWLRFKLVQILPVISFLQC